jgi:hypothetical protein
MEGFTGSLAGKVDSDNAGTSFYSPDNNSAISESPLDDAI